MQKLFVMLKKYKLALITAVIVLLIGLILFTGNSSIKTVNDSMYAFKYDNTWKVKDKKKDSIVLKHSSGSRIIIQISELTDDYRYSTIDELIDELIYNIQLQNKNYNLISKKEDSLTKYNFDGYKLLYESDKEQVMICMYKKSDKLITIRFEATDDYFDILLDSVHNIIYNFDVKDTKFDLKNSIKLNTSKVNYSSNDALDKVLDKDISYEIAKHNYYVKYSIPTNFIRNDFDSTFGIFDFNLNKEGSINLTVDIFNRNIYEYLDKEETINVYNNYSLFHKDGNDDYSEFGETLTKLDGKYLGYIYKNSYIYNKAHSYDKDFKSKDNKRRDENAELIYALDNNHILVIKFETVGLPITEKLISMIKIIDIKNYASYISILKENNFLIGKLQRFANNDKNKIDLITLKIPDKYEEIDKNANIYLERYYGYHYDEDIEIYDYNVHYELTKLSDKSKIDIVNSVYINSIYGESHKLTYSGDMSIGDKEFKVYTGGYTDVSGIPFTNINRKKYYVSKKVLFYQLSDGGNLFIEITGNGKDITDEIIGELVNFTIEKKDF